MHGKAWGTTIWEAFKEEVTAQKGWQEPPGKSGPSFDAGTKAGTWAGGCLLQGTSRISFPRKGWAQAQPLSSGIPSHCLSELTWGTHPVPPWTPALLSQEAALGADTGLGL